MDISINSYIPVTNVEGPNARFCIWVQGCSIRCKGCANAHMWNKADGTIYDVDKIVDLIASYKDKIEGITFLGGEPLEQIEAVTYISKKVKELGLTVLVFTGYDYPEIVTKNEVQELIKYIDILIDGKYEEVKQDFSRAWVGSSNQNYYFFSNRYDKSIINEFKNKIEIRIDSNNEITLNGMGKFKEIMNVI